MWFRMACATVLVAACSEPTFDPSHPIDRILGPKLLELGVPIRYASSDELCRRLAIDLLGRGPTREDMVACADRSVGAMFDDFTARPEYLREQRRQWGELLHYDNDLIRPEELVDHDRLVGALYSDELTYGEFATQAAMHPALITLHPDDSWTSFLFTIYLGRSARQDEIDGMRPFVRAWDVRRLCSGAIWFNYYQQELAAGADGATAKAAGDRACVGAFRLEYGINPCQCQPGPFSSGCISDVLGTRIEISGTCANPVNTADPINFLRASERTPGDRTCPDDTTRAECSDRMIADEATFQLAPLVEWQPPTPELLAQQRRFGEALQARPDFWEAAVDRELRKLLGWWQTTFRHPDSDLPAIRLALANELRTTGSIRAIQRLIATSLIYRQPGAAPEIEGVEDMPPWVAGPTKLLGGEPWLATAAAAVGETAGTCDFRAVTLNGYAPQWTDGRLIETKTGSLDELVSPEYSIQSINRLGGCKTEAHRFEVSNVGLTFNQADLSQMLCAYGRGLPTGGRFVDNAAVLIRQLWHRAPRRGEAETMAIEMQRCFDAGSDVGCADRDIAVRWMCQRMLDSAEFATY